MNQNQIDYLIHKAKAIVSAKVAKELGTRPRDFDARKDGLPLIVGKPMPESFVIRAISGDYITGSKLATAFPKYAKCEQKFKAAQRDYDAKSHALTAKFQRYVDAVKDAAILDGIEAARKALADLEASKL